MWFLACAQAPVRPSLGLGACIASIASTLFRPLVRRERWTMTRSNLIESCSNARRRCFDVNDLLYDFSMQREVEALALDILRHAQADEHLDHEEDDQADHGIIDEHRGDADALVEELSNVSLQHARGSAILLDREHPGQQRAYDAAD